MFSYDNIAAYVEMQIREGSFRGHISGTAKRLFIHESWSTSKVDVTFLNFLTLLYALSLLFSYACLPAKNFLCHLVMELSIYYSLSVFLPPSPSLLNLAICRPPFPSHSLSLCLFLSLPFPFFLTLSVFLHSLPFPSLLALSVFPTPLISRFFMARPLFKFIDNA